MKFINAISLRDKLIRLLLVFISGITLAACGGGGDGFPGFRNDTPTADSGSTTAVALFTTAPSAVTIAVGASATYNLGGGKVPYTVTSGNTSVA